MNSLIRSRTEKERERNYILEIDYPLCFWEVCVPRKLQQGNNLHLLNDRNNCSCVFFVYIRLFEMETMPHQSFNCTARKMTRPQKRKFCQNSDCDNSFTKCLIMNIISVLASDVCEVTHTELRKEGWLLDGANLVLPLASFCLLRCLQ